MHSKCDSIEIIIYDKADENVKENFESFFSWYQIGSESDFDFNCIYLLY